MASAQARACCHRRQGLLLSPEHSGAAALHAAGCELITITQYLRPSPRHHPVTRWVKPEEFVALREEAEEIGFAGVMSGPLVRSSYRAGRLYSQAVEARQPGQTTGQMRGSA